MATAAGTVAPVGTLRQRYSETMGRVADAASRSGRAPGDVFVCAVTKYAEMDDIQELVQLGHRDFGESRVQQLVQRASMMQEMQQRQRRLPGLAAAHRQEIRAGGIARKADEPVRWHMIGHLQRNKVKKLIGLTRLIHSVDSLRLVEEIQQVAAKREQTVDVLVQVNCSGESSKQGCAVAAATHLVEQVETFVDMRVRGLMTMAPLSDNPRDAMPTFERCRELFEEIGKKGYADGDYFNILSMGMSSDFEVAIECGSNLIRIGSAIFGAAATGPDEDEE